jgi:integrase
MLTTSSTLAKACKVYERSPNFLRISGATQTNYSRIFKRVCATPVTQGKHLGNFKLSELTSVIFHQAYNKWTLRGNTSANSIKKIISVVLNYCVDLDVLGHNPTRNIRSVPTSVRKVVWTKDQVRQFLDHAYSDFAWRNIGLIVHMCYAWCQRAKDIRLLKWDNLDLDKGVVTLIQTKRGAEVSLPIDENLLQMLKAQRKEFDFQAYVVPKLRASDGAVVPYNRTDISTLANKIKVASGLPPELYVWDLRRTGITELVEAGVDILQIMSVSGHQSPSSLKPYVKHTLKSATAALNKRGKLL